MYNNQDEQEIIDQYQKQINIFICKKSQQIQRDILIIQSEDQKQKIQFDQISSNKSNSYQTNSITTMISKNDIQYKSNKVQAIQQKQQKEQQNKKSFLQQQEQFDQQLAQQHLQLKYEKNKIHMHNQNKQDNISLKNEYRVKAERIMKQNDIVIQKLSNVILPSLNKEKVKNETNQRKHYQGIKDPKDDQRFHELLSLKIELQDKLIFIDKELEEVLFKYIYINQILKRNEKVDILPARSQLQNHMMISDDPVQLQMAKELVKKVASKPKTVIPQQEVEPVVYVFSKRQQQFQKRMAAMDRMDKHKLQKQTDLFKIQQNKQFVQKVNRDGKARYLQDFEDDIWNYQQLKL